MNYAQLQQQIVNRLDQRTDLQQIIYDFSQLRLNYWSAYFFYTSDVADTSITTTPGQYIYSYPRGIRNVKRIRLLIPGNNQAYTTLTAILTLPSATIAVGSTQAFTHTGALTIYGQVVNYTGVTPTSFTGCTGGSGTLGVGTGVSQIAPSTTTTAEVTLPVAAVPVNSVVGFLPAGVISLAGNQVTYTTTDATDFLGCLGGQQGAMIPAGTLVQQIYGVWYPLRVYSYLRLLDMDPLAPPNRSLPYAWAPFGLTFRLFPAPASQYLLEITGNQSPAIPTMDQDDNFWTEDAASLIINDTCSEVYAAYLHNPERADYYRQLAGRDKSQLMKTGWDINMKPRIVKFHW